MISFAAESTESAESEDWASWLCHHLAVDLFIYEVKLARPHPSGDGESGASGSGLTREEYERFTKAIRFRTGARKLSKKPFFLLVGMACPEVGM